MIWRDHFFVVAGPRYWEARALIKCRARHSIDAMQQVHGDVVTVPPVKVPSNHEERP